MLLNKKTYEEFDRLIKKEGNDVLTENLRKLNESMMVCYAESYEQNAEDIKKDLRNRNKFSKLLSKRLKNLLSYQIGVFDAVTTVFNLLTSKNQQIQGQKKPLLILKRVLELASLFVSGFLFGLAFTGELFWGIKVISFAGGIAIIGHIAVTRILIKKIKGN